MKKTVSVLLAVLLVLSMAACAMAETWNHEGSGITIDLPEGMTGEDLSEGDLVALSVTDSDPTAPLYFIFIEYDANFEGLWMQDLGEDSLQSIAEYYAGEGKNYAYQLVSDDEVTLMMMADDDNSEALVIALLNGWFISVEAVASEGYVLAEGAYTDIEKLIGSIHLPE